MIYVKISIHGDHVVITESIKNYVENKLSKLEKYFQKDSDLEAIVKTRVRNNMQIIEVSLPTKLFTLRAEERNTDLYVAIDAVVKKLEGQIRKNKTKINKRYKDKKGFVFNDIEDIEE